MGLLRAVHGLIKQMGPPDLIHAHIHRAALVAVLLGKWYKIPVVVSAQHSALPLRTLTRFEVLEARFALNRANVLLPVSQALRCAIEQYGIHNHFEIVPNTVDTHLFTLDEATCDQKERRRHRDDGAKTVKLLCVANMPVSEVKGHPYLIRALAALHEHVNWQLDLIGDGPKQAEYKQLVRELGLTERVIFHGYQSKAVIARAMQQADMFVLASLWDNMPCVLLEAMATGLPIVATKVGGIPEVVTPEVGLLAEPGDAQSMRQAIVRMSGSLERYAPRQLAALAQRYSMEMVGQQLDEIYHQLLSTKNKVQGAEVQ
ncbi:MAG: glycosyltransferase [Caldilineaceae bacterium]